ncbi:TnsA endonuclease N-terminal domain-containing protein [Lysinibacillus boronitolerans]|nr:TnsA endonuclease N-terminal domain-containing protein [Lysinibacillus boronitolerans]
MPLEETIVIADELGLKHPTDPKTNQPVVMTTDFLLTVDKGNGLVSLHEQ